MHRFYLRTGSCRTLLLGSDYKYILVVGAEVLSRVVDYTDRNTCVIFGDGAGAVVLGKDEGIMVF